MKILQIIPGTSNFYCGGCIRDMALFKAFKKLGHDVILQPLYLPIFADESNVDEHKAILFGGINLYLQQNSSFFKNTPRWIDQIFDSQWLLNLSAKQAGMTKASTLGEMMISMLQGDQGCLVKEFDRFAVWLKEQEKADVIILPNGMLLSLARTIKKEWGIPVICTLQGEDSFIDALPEPYLSEAWRLFEELTEYADALIPVSYYYADVMKKRLNLNDDKCFPVQNGISLDGYGEMNGIPNELTLGYLAHMRQEKGLDLLVDAFIHLKQKPEFSHLKLKIAGTITRAEHSFVEQLKERLNQKGFLNDAGFHVNLSRDEKIKVLKSLSVFSVPAVYGESFGLYIVEAMAAGIPVVQPRHGGFQEIIERTQGGLLFEPNDFDSYVAALADLLSNADKAYNMGKQGRQGVHEHFSVERMAQDVLEVIKRVQN